MGACWAISLSASDSATIRSLNSVNVGGLMRQTFIAPRFVANGRREPTRPGVVQLVAKPVLLKRTYSVAGAAYFLAAGPFLVFALLRFLERAAIVIGSFVSTSMRFLCLVD